MLDYLHDEDFLSSLNESNLRISFVKIVLLSFDENTIREIQGDVLSGNININGASIVRRTLNLSMQVSNEKNTDLTNLENEISLNKKIRVEVGYSNIFPKYKKYGDIIWFPCGIFILTSANIAKGTNGRTLNLTGIDKMGLLNGVAGGTFPAPIALHEVYLPGENEGEYEIKQVPIYNIIQELVHHLGGEPLQNIIINDVPLKGKKLIKYIGDDQIYFTENFESLTYTEPVSNGKGPYKKNADVGYEETDLTYPGELIMNAGETVAAALSKIANILGNYEFFYSVDGKFIFQEKKNFINKQSPMKDNIDAYFLDYSNEKYQHDLSGLKSVISLNQNPKYDNIKNDFIVWGTRKDSLGQTHKIQYHLVIDKKPIITEKSLVYQNIYYDQVNKSYSTKKNDEEVFLEANERGEGLPPDQHLWREEIYRMSLINPSDDDYYYPYYREIQNAWSLPKSDRDLDYKLDFIDTNDEIMLYSVSNIGRRTKVLNDDNVDSLFTAEIPPLLFVRSSSNNVSKSSGKYFQLPDNLINQFSISATKPSAFERIRELLYQHLSYNIQISLTCIPRYYFEAYDILRIEDLTMGIKGNYEITQMSLPLTYNGTMSITATEILKKV